MIVAQGAAQDLEFSKLIHSCQRQSAPLTQAEIIALAEPVFRYRSVTPATILPLYAEGDGSVLGINIRADQESQHITANVSGYFFVVAGSLETRATRMLNAYSKFIGWQRLSAFSEIQIDGHFDFTVDDQVTGLLVVFQKVADVMWRHQPDGKWRFSLRC